jgi:hypothetical protein
MAPSKPKKKAALKDLKPGKVSGAKASQVKGGVSGNSTGRRGYKP